jgi:hypothetical protein
VEAYKRWVARQWRVRAEKCRRCKEAERLQREGFYDLKSMMLLYESCSRYAAMERCRLELPMQSGRRGSGGVSQPFRNEHINAP